MTPDVIAHNPKSAWAQTKVFWAIAPLAHGPRLLAFGSGLANNGFDTLIEGARAAA